MDIFIWVSDSDLLFFFDDVCLCKDLCKCSLSGSLCLHNHSTLFLIPIKSILALWMTLHTHESVRHDTIMNSVTGLKTTKWKFKLYGHCTSKMAHCFGTLMRPQRLLAVLCNHHWIFLTFTFYFDLKCHDVPGCFELALMRICKAIC